jgi:hypothetical protein
MKRTVKIGFALLLAILIPASVIHGQEKKREQRIKIVVADNSGTKVEIDTLIKGDISADSIKLKNGEMIYLARMDSNDKEKHSGRDNDNMVVTYSSDNKGGKKIRKEITIISGDSTEVQQDNGENKVIIVKNGKHTGEGKGGKVVTWSSSSSASSSNTDGETYVYVTDSKNTGKDHKKSYNVKVTTDENGKVVEKTKYVIAKDGMVVSIEGNDEAKVKDLVKDVESKLGVSKDTRK